MDLKTKERNKERKRKKNNVRRKEKILNGNKKK